MANYVGAPLARLIRERAYTAGALVKAQKAVDEGISALRKAVAERREVIIRLAELDEKIQQSEIDPADIRPIRRMPRRNYGPNGTVVSDLIDLIQGAKGAITTKEIISAMVEKHGFPMDTPEHREETRRRIVRPLRSLASKGFIQRLHDTENNKEGVWIWPSE